MTERSRPSSFEGLGPSQEEMLMLLGFPKNGFHKCVTDKKKKRLGVHGGKKVSRGETKKNLVNYNSFFSQVVAVTPYPRGWRYFDAEHGLRFAGRSGLNSGERCLYRFPSTLSSPYG